MDQVPEHNEPQVQPETTEMIPEKTEPTQPDQPQPQENPSEMKPEEAKIEFPEAVIQEEPQQPEKKELSEQEKKDIAYAESLQFNSELMDQQHNEIQKEIEENSPLISEILPLEMLEFEFSENIPFLTKVRV
jgi:hypothetical protein